MGLRRRVHHRTQLHAFAQKGASGESSGRHDQGRRPHSPSRRLRGTTTILRVHLPKALEVPQSIARLNAGKPPTDSSDEAMLKPFSMCALILMPFGLFAAYGKIEFRNATKHKIIALLSKTIPNHPSRR